MCRPVPCPVCGKTTWEGCGQHVDQVKAQVPDAQWCPGHPGLNLPPAAAEPASAAVLLNRQSSRPGGASAGREPAPQP